MRVLIAGVGNIFLEDDGFGPEVVRALQHEILPSGARLVDYGIRGVHLAYDLLESWDALVLIDALPVTGVPGKLAIIEVDPESEGPQGGFDAHSMHPSSVFASLQALGGTLPRTFVVGAHAKSTGDGIGLSAEMRDSVGQAASAVMALVRSIDVDCDATTLGPEV
ncbi:hydrogenase maturation protease [Rhodococcus sp. NPDC059969]|uniref:hydrogenase maturation protease n=1 Tax=unclassified Rhodococcus (in: high G+C Gram-positive bacteria) TaxID=192944 RepID=UPI003644105F